MSDTYSIGTTLDTAASVGGNGTVIALLKLMTNQLNAGLVSGDATASGDMDALDEAVTITDLKGASAVAIDLRGTFTATIQFEASINGTNWFAIRGHPAIGGIMISTATATGAWVVPVGGYQQFRVKATAFTSGTITATLRAEPGPNVVQSVHPGSSITLGDATANTPTVMLSTASATITTGPSFPHFFNGTTWDRGRSANGANNTTGTGLQGSAQMAWDGAAYQRCLCDTTGTQKTGKFTASIKTALTVEAAAYAAADLVGGKHTYTSATRINAGGAIIKAILIGDQAANSAANSVYDLILFDSDPAATTFTENSPLDVADADLNKIIACVRLDGVAGSTLFTNADNNVIYKPVEIPIQLTGAITTLTGALIARGGPTFAATTDVFVTLLVEYT